MENIYQKKNAEIISQHSNNKETSVSALAPLYKEQFLDKEKALKTAKNSLPKSSKIEGIDLKNSKPNFTKDMFFDVKSKNISPYSNLANLLIRGQYKAKEVHGTTSAIDAKLHNDVIENRPINIIIRALLDSKNNCIDDITNLAKEIPNNNSNSAMENLKNTKANMLDSIAEAAKLYKKERENKNIELEASAHTNNEIKVVGKKKSLSEEKEIKSSKDQNIEE